MRNNMMKNSSSWFCHYINNYRYSIPRYWKEACFSKEEIKCRNDSLIPDILWKIVQQQYWDRSYHHQCAIYNVLLWP